MDNLLEPLIGGVIPQSTTYLKSNMSGGSESETKRLNVSKAALPWRPIPAIPVTKVEDEPETERLNVSKDALPSLPKSVTPGTEVEDGPVPEETGSRVSRSQKIWGKLKSPINTVFLGIVMVMYNMIKNTLDFFTYGSVAAVWYKAGAVASTGIQHTVINVIAFIILLILLIIKLYDGRLKYKKYRLKQKLDELKAEGLQGNNSDISEVEERITKNQKEIVKFNDITNKILDYEVKGMKLKSIIVSGNLIAVIIKIGLEWFGYTSAVGAATTTVKVGFDIASIKALLVTGIATTGVTYVSAGVGIIALLVFVWYWGNKLKSKNKQSKDGQQETFEATADAATEVTSGEFGLGGGGSSYKPENTTIIEQSIKASLNAGGKRDVLYSLLDDWFGNNSDEERGIINEAMDTLLNLLMVKNSQGEWVCKAKLTEYMRTLNLMSPSAVGSALKKLINGLINK